MIERKTQSLVSEWGQPTLVVSKEIPTHVLRRRLGREHVMTPDAEIELLVRQAIRKSPNQYTPTQVQQTVQAALWIHHENRAEYIAIAQAIYNPAVCWVD